MLNGNLSSRGQTYSAYGRSSEPMYRKMKDELNELETNNEDVDGRDFSRCREQGSISREALYIEFAPLVTRLVRQYGGNAELRNDLQGEIYYRFCTILDAYDPERGIPLRPYIVRQLTANVYTFVRQNWRTAAREQKLDEVREDKGFGVEEDPTINWLQEIVQEQVVAQLPTAMRRIPARQRQIIIWRYYEERSFIEIADLLGIQSATVRSLLRHGLTNLRKHIQSIC